MTKAATFEGKPCVRCGSSTRYQNSKQCVPCARKHQESMRKKATDAPRPKTSIFEKGLIPKKPERDRNWPTVLAADKSSIQQDPFYVMAERGQLVTGRFE